MASKALAAFSGLGAVLSGVLLVIGIIMATKKQPESDCFDGTALEVESESESILVILALPAVVSGLFGLIGSCIGIPGGLKSNRGCTCGALFFWITSAIGLWITVLTSTLWATGLNHMCNDYQCCSADLDLTPSCCTYSSYSDVCCTQEGFVFYYSCESSHEFWCDIADFKLAVTIAAVAAALVVSLLSGFGCGALCCCKLAFGFEDGQLKEDAQQQPSVVVGRAVKSQLGMESNDEISLTRPDCQA